MVLKCDCKNDFQDKEHGKGKRVHNPMKVVKPQPPKYRCTVCGREKTE
jgi:aspartate carbamoyltransferase regulatory subunit